MISLSCSVLSLSLSRWLVLPLLSPPLPHLSPRKDKTSKYFSDLCMVFQLASIRVVDLSNYTKYSHSTGAEEAGTVRYCLASLQSVGKFSYCCCQ